jgi:hypothetical protein
LKAITLNFISFAAANTTYLLHFRGQIYTDFYESGHSTRITPITLHILVIKLYHPGFTSSDHFSQHRMSSGFDICEQTKQAIRGRSETWNFIRGFTSHWVTPIQEGDGYSEAELSAAEERLGISLPAALKEAYTLFGRRSDLTRNREYLLEPTAIYLKHGALIFRHENQGASVWGILIEDTQNPDPPVYHCYCVVDDIMEDWEIWLARFSLACVDLILWESLYDPRMATESREIDDEGLHLVGQLYTELPTFEGLDSYTPFGMRWFTGTDLLLCDTGMDLSVRARNLEAIGSIRNNLPGEWLNE